MKFFERFTTQYDTHGSHSRYWWLEELSDVRLITGAAKLKDEDKELLTLYFVEQYTTREIATHYGISHVSISARIRKIAKQFTGM